MLKKIYQDQFIKNNTIFFVGSMIVAALNYLYYPIVSRMLSLEAFGELQTLISLLSLSSILLSVFNIIIINVVSNSTIEKNKEVIFILRKIWLFLTISLAVIITILCFQLKNFFNFSSFTSFICLSVLLVLGLFTAFRSAILQGKQNFLAVSASGILNSAGRLLFAAFFIFLGWSTLGAINGLIIGQVLALVYVFYKTKKELPRIIKTKIVINQEIKKELQYGFLVFVVILCITFLYTADIVIIKHYFPPEQAGLYSGIATIARIIFFITGSVAGVMLPSLKISDNNKNNNKILLKALLLIVIIGGIALALFFTKPEFIIKLLIGSRYLIYLYLFPKLSILLFMISIINLLFLYYLALRKYFLFVIAIVSPFIIIILSYFRHNSLSQIINNFLIVSILILSYLLFRSLLKNFFRLSLLKV